MALIKWDPFGDDFDRMFSRLPSMLPDVQFDWNAGIDLYEENNNLVAEMSMPGFKKEEPAYPDNALDAIFVLC